MGTTLRHKSRDKRGIGIMARWREKYDIYIYFSQCAKLMNDLTMNLRALSLSLYI